MNTYRKYALPPLPEGMVLEGIWVCPEDELISYRDACIQAAIEAGRERQNAGVDTNVVVDDLRSHASMARWQAHSLSYLYEAAAARGAAKTATLSAAIANLERMAMRLEDSANYIDMYAPQPADPVNKERVGWRYRIKSNEKWTLTDTKPTGIPTGGQVQEVWVETAEPVVAEFPVKGKLHGPLGWIANTTNPEPVNSDRQMLLKLMEAFDTETWQCPSCGHAEDTTTMDSAYMLRDYLKDATVAGPEKVDAKASVQSDDDVFSRLYEIANRDTAVSVTVRADDLRDLLARYR